MSDTLRLGDDLFTTRRRRLAGATLAAMSSLGVVTAYQFGLIRRVPEPRIGPLDASRVDAGGEAYQMFKTPDGALALASYGATLVLVGMGGSGRAKHRPWLPLAMAAKVLGDAAFGLYLTAEQISKQRRLCSWCLVAAAASLVSVPQVFPEAGAAARALRRR